jgi:hypothetical protein
MNDTQMLTIALATVPTMLTVLIGILLNNARLSDVNSRLGEFRSHMDARFNDVDRRFRNEGDVAYRTSPRRRSDRCPSEALGTPLTAFTPS